MITPAGAKKALVKRQVTPKEASLFRLEDHLFPQQLAFVLDESPNALAVCSRRSGKTIACAADLVHTAINYPDTVSLYITLSRNNAKKIIWKEITKLNKQYKLGGKENLSELSITFNNGSIIYLSGAKDTSEIEKFRGLALKSVYIDETQSFREYVQDLIDDVLSPALMDYAGKLRLIGTPGPIPAGFFYDCSNSTGNTWSKHSWTFWDNPYIAQKSGKTHSELLQRELQRMGVPESHPTIQREWYGRWVQDSESLLLTYKPELNHYNSLPEVRDSWHYIMGIDLGMDDADAIAVLAWSEHTPVTYLVHEKVTAGQGLTELVTQINEINSIYRVEKMVIDQGGLGKKLAEEMRRQHKLPVQPADKARKMENIAFLNDALRTKRFMAKRTSRFAEDSYRVEIDRDKSTPDKTKVSNRFHSDIIDAVLYAFKESPAFTYIKPKEPPKYGTHEWAREEQDKMFEAALEQAQEQAELNKQISGYWDE